VASTAGGPVARRPAGALALPLRRAAHPIPRSSAATSF